MARKLILLRYSLLGTVLLFSLVTLSLSGDLLNHEFPNFIVVNALDFVLVLSIITMLALISSFTLDYLGKGSVLTMVAIELVLSFILTILWVASAGFASSTGTICTDGFSHCSNGQALIAFAWLNFLFLLAWFTTLAALATIAHRAGNTSVWISSIHNADAFIHKHRQDSAQQQHTGALV
ncbi:hypothetical protein K439DRAFT_1641641 [Ramaria rubella]|nr:hypothetical protein K439DRAFT_1641641 [Ramaria rubella]